MEDDDQPSSFPKNIKLLIIGLLYLLVLSGFFLSFGA